jgi:hypothetical protein
MSPLTPEQLEEVEKAVAANRAMQDALNRQRRMETEALEIELMRGGDDPQAHEPAFRDELQGFKDQLDDAGIQYAQSAVAFDSVDAYGYPIGEFALKFVKDYGPMISVALAAWITGRYGRKVKAKFRDIEVEAGSLKDVECLMDKLLEVMDQERRRKEEGDKHD